MIETKNEKLSESKSVGLFLKLDKNECFLIKIRLNQKLSLCFRAKLSLACLIRAADDVGKARQAVCAI